MSSEAEIRALLDRRADANRAGDAATLVTLLAKDVVAYMLPSPLRFAGAAARDEAACRAWFDTWDGPVESVLADPDIRVDGDLAVVHGLCRMRGSKRVEGPIDLWFRTTLVLQRRAEGWRIVHEHASVPMAMDGSGRAVIDLTPENAS